MTTVTGTNCSCPLSVALGVACLVAFWLGDNPGQELVALGLMTALGGVIGDVPVGMGARAATARPTRSSGRSAASRTSRRSPVLRLRSYRAIRALEGRVGRTRGETDRMPATLGPRMGRDVPSPVAPSAHETTVEIGAGPADEEPMTPVSPVTLDDDQFSPELALVDPDLAGRLRLTLPDPELERVPLSPTGLPREVDVVPRLRLAPTPVEKPEVVAEPVVEKPEGVEEPVVVEEPSAFEASRVVAASGVLDEPHVVAEEHDGPERPEVVEEPVVVEEPSAFEGSHAVAASGVLDEPHEVDEPHDDDDVGEAELGGESLRVEPRPVDIGTPAPLTPVAATTAAWPPVPDRDTDLDPERGRLRRLVFVFGVGMVVASLAVVGLVALFGDRDPPPSLTLAGPAPAPQPGAPKPGSGEAQGGSAPSTPSGSTSAKKQSAPAAAPAAGSQRLVWAPVEGAVSYRVELFRGDRQVLRETTRSPAIVIPAKWKHQGRVQSLTPGTYRWYVWPVLSSGPGAKAVVQAELVVP